MSEEEIAAYYERLRRGLGLPPLDPPSDQES